MSLRSFEMLPFGPDGWTSGKLLFGRNTTLLLGGNGAGKTPLVRALAFALGQPVQLPDLIKEKCAGVTLVVSDGSDEFAITRKFLGPELTEVESRGARWTLHKDKELSEFLLPKLGVSLRQLMTKQDQVSPPYLSVLGPMFIVDQDFGWATTYSPHLTQQFIKDQAEEVLRWVLELPARNRVVDKSELHTAQVILSSVQHQIRIKRDVLTNLETSLREDRSPDALARLSNRKEVLETEFRAAYTIVDTAGREAGDVDVRTREINHARQETSYKLGNLKRRRTQLANAQAELGMEIGALQQNETAAEAFRLFCGAGACQLFRKPDESYGRRVLYLKDQLKDFESNTGDAEREIGLLEEQLAAAEGEAARATEDHRHRLELTGASAALQRLESLGKELADVQSRLDMLQRVQVVRDEIELLVGQEHQASESVAEATPRRGSAKPLAHVLDARAVLADTFREWMVVLRTPNVSYNVSVNEELQIRLGSEVFAGGSSQSGSTRTRLVLAFHAAALETSIRIGGVHPPLLILDAPRQHELSAADLRAFVQRFCEMARARELSSPQLVFSASDPDVVPQGCIDALWEPKFKFGNARRFLGPA